jgi:hypothetical protein
MTLQSLQRVDLRLRTTPMSVGSTPVRSLRDSGEEGMPAHGRVPKRGVLPRGRSQRQEGSILKVEMTA